MFCFILLLIFLWPLEFIFNLDPPRLGTTELDERYNALIEIPFFV